MFKKIFLSISVLIVFITFSFCEDASDNQTLGKLYPPIQPYQTGYLKVPDLHEIFYQLGGNPDGKPVMYLHGGPGAGCSAHDFQYFNPEKFHIVLHDQRGSGQSRPESGPPAPVSRIPGRRADQVSWPLPDCISPV